MMPEKVDRRPPLEQRLKSLYTLRRFATTPKNPVKNRFIVFGQSRCGSTLLTELLASHPDVDCRGEIYYHAPFLPHLYRQAVERTSHGSTFGFKMHVHQLDSKLHLDKKNQQTFVKTLRDDGYRFIYLRRRNVVRHVMSDQLRSAGGSTHVRAITDTKAEPLGKASEQPDKLRVDITDVINHIRIREHYWTLAEELLQDISYHTVEYERDLADGTQHQATLDALFDFLGLDRAPVSTNLRRINTKPLEDLVENFGELETSLSGTPWKDYLYVA